MTYQKFYNNKDSGLILVDIVVALALATIFIALITQSTYDSRNLFEFARNRNLLFDAYRKHSDQFTGLLPYDSKVITIVSDESSPEMTITGSARWYGNDRIQTDVTTSYANRDETQLESTNSQSVTFSSVRSYPFESEFDTAGTPLCSVDFMHNDTVGSYSFLQKLRKKKSAPVQPTIMPISLPILASIPLTDLEIRNGIAYISTDSTIASHPDMFIVDIRNIDDTKILSSRHTGPGIASFALAGNRIFAAAASTAAQLHVIKIDTLESLTLESKHQLQLPYATATPPMASSIFYMQKRLYLGTEKWVGDEFIVIDVRDNGNLPQIEGFETSTKINDIYVRNKRAYLAGSDSEQLRIVDVENPTEPSLMDSFTPSGWERQSANSLSFFEDSLALGRSSGGFNIVKDPEIFVWPEVSESHYLDSLHEMDIPGGVYGIVIDREHIFAATRQGTGELSIFDRSLSKETTLRVDLPTEPKTMTCDGNSLYILSRTAPVIYQITF